MRCDECGCALAGFSVCSLSLNKSARPRVPRARKNSERLRTVCRAWTLVLSRHRFAPTWPLSQVLHVPHRQVTEALQSTFCNIKGKEKLPNYVECKFGIDWANDLWNVLLWLIRQFNKEIVCGKKTRREVSELFVISHIIQRTPATQSSLLAIWWRARSWMILI